jgi:hypothetical protein
MSLKKIGSPVKIVRITESALALDPNLIVTKLKEKYPTKSFSLDQLHEALKSIGVIDYSSDDLQHLIDLLQSSGVTIVK